MAWRGRREILLASIVLEALAACSGEENLAAPDSLSTEQDQSQAASRAEALGITDPPEVPVVRETTPEENPPVVSCLAEGGWNPKLHPDGTIEVGPFTAEQEESYNLAVYVCGEQYPVADVYTAELTQEQHRVVYVSRIKLLGRPVMRA